MVALIAWALGFIVFEVIAVMKLSIGGSIPSMIIAGLCYYVPMQLKLNKNSLI